MVSNATPAEPDASDAGQPTQDRASAEVEKVVQDLEDLKKSYQDRASELPKQHIGVYIGEIAQTLPAWSLRCVLALKIRSQIRSTMNFVLDQYQDIARLNEPDHNQKTPLHSAIMWDAIDCFEILMARGADPYNKSGSETPFKMLFGQDSVTAHKFNPEFRGLILLRDLIKLWHEAPDTAKNAEHVSFACRTIKTTGLRIGPHFGYQEIGLNQALFDGPWTDDRERDDFRTWFHVSLTNVPVLYDVCRTIEGIVNKNRSDAERIPVLDSFCSIIHPPVVTQGNPLLTYRDSMYDFLRIEGKTVGSAMVFPYLVLERINDLLASRARYEAATEDIKGLPASRYGAGNSLFLGVCLDRTLDEAYFPSMDDAFFKKRNQDQVVSREWRRTNNKVDPNRAPLLLVSQTWLWNFNSVLLSAYSTKRVSSRFPRFLMNGGRRVPRFFGHETAPPLELQMGIIIASQISEFGEEHDRENEGSKFKSALHMFETAVVSALSDVQQYLDARPGSYNINQQKKQEQEFIHHMSDIHSELDMISLVLEQQKKIMNKFLRETISLQERATGEEKQGWAMVKNARALLNDYSDRVQKIDRDADRVDKTIESYLNLKRTYASIEDTRNSLMVGFAATAFAFVTVIFTPLSFMTSLFALPVNRFAKNQVKSPDTEAYVFNSSYIGGYTALAAIVTWIITIALLVGLYFYWKISSRSEKDEVKTNTSETNAERMSTQRRNEKNIGDYGDGRGKSARGSTDTKSQKNGALQGAKLWRRKSHNEESSSV